MKLTLATALMVFSFGAFAQSFQAQKDKYVNFINKQIQDMQLNAKCVTLAKANPDLDACRKRALDAANASEKERLELFKLPRVNPTSPAPKNAAPAPFEVQKENLLTIYNKRIQQMQLGLKCFTDAKVQADLEKCTSGAAKVRDQNIKEREELIRISEEKRAKAAAAAAAAAAKAKAEAAKAPATKPGTAAPAQQGAQPGAQPGAKPGTAPTAAPTAAPAATTAPAPAPKTN